MKKYNCQLTFEDGSTRDVSFSAKEHLSELKLGEFIRLSNILDGKNEMGPDEMIGVLSVVTDLEDEIIWQLPMKDAKAIAENVVIDMENYVATDRTDEVIIKDESFFRSKVIENRITGNRDYLKDETVGAFSECNAFLQYFSKLEDGNLTVMSYLAAILFRRKDELLPVKETERIDFIASRKELFEKEMPVTVMLDTAFFFREAKNKLATSIIKKSLASAKI